MGASHTYRYIKVPDKQTAQIQSAIGVKGVKNQYTTGSYYAIEITSTMSISDYVVYCGSGYWYQAGGSSGTQDKANARFIVGRNGTEVYRKLLVDFNAKFGTSNAKPYGCATHITDCPIEVGDTLCFIHMSANTSSFMVFGV